MTGQTHRMTSAVAMEDCTIARLEKAVVLRTMHEEPAFAETHQASAPFRNSPVPVAADGAAPGRTWR